MYQATRWLIAPASFWCGSGAQHQPHSNLSLRCGLTLKNTFSAPRSQLTRWDLRLPAQHNFLMNCGQTKRSLESFADPCTFEVVDSIAWVRFSVLRDSDSPCILCETSRATPQFIGQIFYPIRVPNANWFPAHSSAAQGYAIPLDLDVHVVAYFFALECANVFILFLFTLLTFIFQLILKIETKYWKVTSCMSLCKGISSEIFNMLWVFW
jgi:hypothetical protein